MNIHIHPKRTVGKRDFMIFGHFIEHFHRQIYGGVYDPGNPLSDASGFRQDVLEALRRIRVPILRWPGGCFVSAYHWKEAVGKQRQPMFDKAWRVEDPNSFGTDEYIKLCRAIGCAPYICTNAGTGGAEEMSDWVEYCNLPTEGKYAKWRNENGYTTPHAVKYWSIGNENYGDWEIGAKSPGEWARLVLESAKMMRRVDPSIELSAAALDDLDWNIELLKSAGNRLHWISIHKYWDFPGPDNVLANYEQTMACTHDLDAEVRRVKGLLTAMDLQDSIRIAFDEWNLRGWYHPNVHTVHQAENPADYLSPRDENDCNSAYTLADAVFSACFLNMCLRNCDVVGMANFSPVVNTRGAIFTHPEGIVLRSTYYVFDMYANLLGDEIMDILEENAPSSAYTAKDGQVSEVRDVDVLVTRDSATGRYILAAVNKLPDKAATFQPHWDGLRAPSRYTLTTLTSANVNDYNDIGSEPIKPQKAEKPYAPGDAIELMPHSVNILAFF